MTRLRSLNCRPRIGFAMLAVMSLLVSAECMAEEAASTPAILKWRNGDELPGELSGSTSDRLTWQSAMLSQPISIELDYLESIRVAAPAAVAISTGPFRFELVGGNVLCGSLAGLDADHILVRSPRHGDVNVKRSSVLNVVRIDSADLRDLTRTAGRGWQSLDPAKRRIIASTTQWNLSESGQATTSVAGAKLFLPGDLPNVCEIRLVLEWKGQPGIALAHGTLAELANRKGAFEIDTWSDELVVQSIARSDDFEHLLSLSPTRKALQLRLIWDRENGKLSVYDEGAKLLAEIPCDRRQDDREAGGSGLLLENKGSDLTVKVLRVSPWSNAQSPRPVAVGQDTVRTVDGREVVGRVSRLDDDGSLWINAAESGEMQIALPQISEIGRSNGTPAPEPTGNCELTMYDGTQLRGQLVSVRDGIARLKTSFSDEVVSTSMEGLRELKFAAATPRSDWSTSHVLRLGDRQLHGVLASEQNKLGWRPVGSDDVIPLNPSGALSIKRVTSAKTTNDASNRSQDVLYLTNGDQAPCVVTSIDDDGVQFTSEFTKIDRIAHSELRAIEFNIGSTRSVGDFRDPLWQISPQQANAVDRTDSQISVRGPASLSHPEILKQGSLEFDLAWRRQMQIILSLNLFTSVNARQVIGPRFQINLIQDQLQIHSISSDGNVQSYSVTVKEAGKERPKATFSFSGGRAETKLFVDGALICSMPMLDKKSSGNGISISCQSVNAARQFVQEEVNAEGQVVRRVVREAVAPIPANGEPMLSISNLRTSDLGGVLRGMSLGERDRAQFLTVPRSRRHNPPQHALIAKNGDLVRGDLLSLSQTLAHFRIGMEDVAVPRDRLSGIVWLEKEGETEKESESPAATGQELQAVFANGSILRVSIESVEGDSAVGRHPVFGTCRLAIAEMNELRRGNPDKAGQVLAYSGWTLINAKEPVIPGGDGSDGAFGTYSPLIGKEAEDFTLNLLDGKQFRLSEHKNKVVVLDFWATWCVPCVQAFPQLIAATSKFSPDEVLFIAVNQQENAAAVREFLEAHEWNAKVALDQDGEIGRKYDVDGLPHTIVIGRGGKIEKVGLGFSPKLEAELGRTLSELVAPKDAADAPAGDR